MFYEKSLSHTQLFAWLCVHSELDSPLWCCIALSRIVSKLVIKKFLTFFFLSLENSRAWWSPPFAKRWVPSSLIDSPVPSSLSEGPVSDHIRAKFFKVDFVPELMSSNTCWWMPGCGCRHCSYASWRHVGTIRWPNTPYFYGGVYASVFFLRRDKFELWANWHGSCACLWTRIQKNFTRAKAHPEAHSFLISFPQCSQCRLVRPFFWSSLGRNIWSPATLCMISLLAGWDARNNWDWIHVPFEYKVSLFESTFNSQWFNYPEEMSARWASQVTVRRNRADFCFVQPLYFDYFFLPSLT
jgi:hypothetical protein